jgi:glycopeptide antibiotics resistance protein
MKKRLTAIVMLIAYSAALIKVIVLKDMPLIRIGRLRFNFGGAHEAPPNLIPFRTILQYLHREKGLMIAAINIVGNIILFVPVGFLLPLVYRNMNWKNCLTLAVATGLAIEGMQALLHVGIFDIDDVILNGFGVMIGYWVFRMLTRKRSVRKTVLLTESN